MPRNDGDHRSISLPEAWMPRDDGDHRSISLLEACSSRGRHVDQKVCCGRYSQMGLNRRASCFDGNEEEIDLQATK